MNIDLISDAHLEYFPHPLRVAQKFKVQENPDYLVIAGDFFMIKFEDEFKSILDHLYNNVGYKKIFYVTGNHEYYKSSIEVVDKFLTDLNSDKFFYLNSFSSPIDLCYGYKIFGRTLWSDFRGNDPLVVHACRSHIQDFGYIQYKDRLLTPEDVFEFNKTHLSDLEDNVDTSTIVVTHFSPTVKDANPKFKGTLTNPYFDVSIEDFIDRKSPYKMLHGHTHYKRHTKVYNTEIHSQPVHREGHPHDFDVFRFVLDDKS